LVVLHDKTDAVGIHKVGETSKSKFSDWQHLKHRSKHFNLLCYELQMIADIIWRDCINEGS
jgi:hypothetical protein